MIQKKQSNSKEELEKHEIVKQNNQLNIIS